MSIKDKSLAALNVLAVGWVITTAAAIGMVLLYAPMDSTLGWSQKIFYLHVGAACATAVCVCAAFAASVIYLIKKNLTADDVALGAGQSVVVCGAIVLASGMMWAKAAWGTYFPLTEVKLLLFLVLWVIFAAYMVLRNAIEDKGKMRAGAAVFAIMGFVSMPFAYFVSRWTQGQGQLHPNLMKAGDSGMEKEMLITLLASIASWVLAAAVLMIVRSKIAMVERVIEGSVRE
jgi:heme exporter protein C